MPTYLVDTKAKRFTTYRIEANSEEEAMDKVTAGEGEVFCEEEEDFEVLGAEPDHRQGKTVGGRVSVNAGD